MSGGRFLVTGARGFIGSWVTKHLLGRGFEVTGFDIDDRSDRMSLILSPEEMQTVHFVRGDVNDLAFLVKVIRERSISHVIHTAGLQTPDCRQRPIVGATVNVVGTLTVFEAARACRDQVACVAYASSGAVLGTDVPGAPRPFLDETPRSPQTLYGVFKTANEQCARLYWQDEGIRSVGLRPPVVYGVGRDRGLTAGTTLAIVAALLRKPCEIGFSGPANVEYVEDVARCFADCALRAPAGAPACNMLGEVLTVEDMIGVIEEMFPSARGTITCLPVKNKMVNDVTDAGLQALIGPFRPLSYREGAIRTVEHFRRLMEAGRLLSGTVDTENNQSIMQVFSAERGASTASGMTFVESKAEGTA
jgi:nucleoside-diphosphate-sugar epimerase